MTIGEMLNKRVELLSLEEVAETLGVSDETVRRWGKKNGLPYMKIGGTIRIAKDDLAEWLEKSYTGNWDRLVGPKQEERT